MSVSLGMNHSTDLLSTADDSRDENLALLEVAVLAFIFLTIVIGNTCVLLALFVSRLRLRRMYFFLLHLSLADLVTGFFNVLPQLIWDITYRFYGNNFLCKSVKFLQILGPYLSSYTLVMTAGDESPSETPRHGPLNPSSPSPPPSPFPSHLLLFAVDRHQAICYPLRASRWPHRRSIMMISLAWALSLLFCSPQAFIFSYQEVSNGTFDCWGTFHKPFGERAYVTWYAISVFFVPLLILIYTYTCICCKIWSIMRMKSAVNEAYRPSVDDKHEVAQKVINGSNRSLLKSSKKSLKSAEGSQRRRKRVMAEPRLHSLSGLTKAKVKSVKLTVTVILCYVICSLPFIVVQLWVCWSHHSDNLWKSPAITIVMLMASLNSGVNPWIYLYFNDNLFINLKKFICCYRSTHRSHSQSENISNL